MKPSQSRASVAYFLINTPTCPEVPQRLAVTPAAGRYWQARAFAPSTEPARTVITDGPGVALIPRSASTSPRTGGCLGLRCFVKAPCAWRVGTTVAWLRLGWWITWCRSRTAVPALIGPTCSLSASLATTARRPERLPAGARPPCPRGRGVESLRLGGADARACPNFSACKLKQGGIPPDGDIHGRS